MGSKSDIKFQELLGSVYSKVVNEILPNHKKYDDFILF